jgi:hypothetical protein
MKTITVFGIVLMSLLVACSPASLEDRVLDVDNEILYYDVISEQLPANQISYFGVSFGDTEEALLELHGQPLVESEYTFGRIRNLEYSFTDDNTTDVLFHFEQGLLSSVLVTAGAQELFLYDSFIGANSSRLVDALGVWTVSDTITPYRIRFYDDFGYEFYQRRGEVEQIYFTTPNRGLQPAGVDVLRNESANMTS